MADHADDFHEDIFVYRGGWAPQHVTHVNILIDKSLDEIEDNAFENCQYLSQVDTHDGLRKVGKDAFCQCWSLRQINLKSVVEIDDGAFFRCENLESVEFGTRLEKIGNCAFSGCNSLQPLKLPPITTIGSTAFYQCTSLTDVELPERLEAVGIGAFWGCERLRRIAIPLKRDLFEFSLLYEKYNQFDGCEELRTIDLIGGIHETVASLHMESWRTEMISEINRINQVLPNTPADDKTGEILQWMEGVMDKIDHYKTEHCRYVKEGITLLELALWKAKLLDEMEDHSEEGHTKKVKVDAKAARKERRITCGADTVIKNVLPFLQLE